ncbi:bifunctional 2-polyprenyl-6-hydroxyphenol methylase/3-demethylubiquinol 3-O-methyltransferase UbiG [Corynebacterium sp. ES2715-CONJ3]|uniref:class I SAM-dependent methyltransferase n=1 Tax=Corynebacterium sp. ES2715-CONJ3 TaxID=2974028 RepID=UPI0021684767|nr:class I SAM-dependent methyltransferase [Corynebacterium sp. ES2715-CONJ3]MCS4492037.1 class I SAM-dependent methyltransferase [Corynebacterium sp. ES2715-CONJ3]
MPTFLPTLARLATLSRSVELLKAVTKERSDRDFFYQFLAKDSAQQLAALAKDINHWDLHGRGILDIGGGPGYFEEEFFRAGAHYVGLEPDLRELSAAGLSHHMMVRGDGMSLPFATDSFDITYSSNVVEHIPDPQAMMAEMARVTTPGGLIFISYTIWLGPFGGHETGLWQHYVGGRFARWHYERKHGHRPKNFFGQSLFAVSCSQGLKWAHALVDLHQVEICAFFPRYHPWWAWWIWRVPLVREFLVSNLVIILRKKHPSL